MTVYFNEHTNNLQVRISFLSSLCQLQFGAIQPSGEALFRLLDSDSIDALLFKKDVFRLKEIQVIVLLSRDNWCSCCKQFEFILLKIMSFTAFSCACVLFWCESMATRGAVNSQAARTWSQREWLRAYSLRIWVILRRLNKDNGAIWWVIRLSTLANIVLVKCMWNFNLVPIV